MRTNGLHENKENSFSHTGCMIFTEFCSMDGVQKNTGKNIEYSVAPAKKRS